MRATIDRSSSSPLKESIVDAKAIAEVAKHITIAVVEKVSIGNFKDPLDLATFAGNAYGIIYDAVAKK